MTFAQRRNRLTTHFSERIPVVKRRMAVISSTKSWRRYSYCLWRYGCTGCVFSCCQAPLIFLISLCLHTNSLMLPKSIASSLCNASSTSDSSELHPSPFRLPGYYTSLCSSQLAHNPLSCPSSHCLKSFQLLRLLTTRQKKLTNTFSLRLYCWRCRIHL